MDTHQYLIIGGSTKCGTTSVFNYFEYHPQVCPCIMKESRYFWADAYPLSAASRSQYKTNNFSGLFNKCQSGQVRIEATPDYLYSIASANRIHHELQNSKLVFLLRHPVTRLISWYKFAMVNGLISQNTTFEEYVGQQQHTSLENIPQHLRALEQGKYADHLEQYMQVFGTARILAVFYEDLVDNPGLLCSEIARFAGIDEHYFKGYDFKVFNKTVSAKSVSAHRLFRNFKRSVRPFTRLFHTSIRKKLKLAGHKLEASYQSVNKKAATSEVVISPELRQFLESYYREDRIKLQQLTGKQPPWQHLSIR